MLKKRRQETRRGHMMHRSLSSLLLLAPLGMFASSFTPNQVANVGTISTMQQHSSKVNQRALTGTVTDEHGEPIVGATVIERGKKTGTITNADGVFLIASTPGSMLTISYVGFSSQTVKAHNGMRITLAEEAKGRSSGGGLWNDEEARSHGSSIKCERKPTWLWRELHRQPTCLRVKLPDFMCGKTRHNPVEDSIFSFVEPAQ